MQSIALNLIVFNSFMLILGNFKFYFKIFWPRYPVTAFSRYTQDKWVYSFIVIT